MVKITSSISLFSHFQKGSFGEAASAYVWVFTADWIIDYQVNVGGMEAISHSVKNAREYAEMTKKEKKFTSKMKRERRVRQTFSSSVNSVSSCSWDKMPILNELLVKVGIKKVSWTGLYNQIILRFTNSSFLDKRIRSLHHCAFRKKRSFQNKPLLALKINNP